MHRLLAGFLITCLASASAAQGPVAATLEFAPQVVQLTNLDAFRPTNTNWKIAGGASADRGRALALAASPGSGVVVNVPVGSVRSPLITTWEHGDIDLSFDMLVPKGSTAGVLLMSRYNLSLADSWTTRAPTAADLGGVGSTPPRQNASRAPGLWQHVEVRFRAPTFAGQQKVTNARFSRVIVNGVVVHENVEVAGPTRGATFSDERPTGALTFRGDGGPIALRNIQYKSYSGAVTLAGLHYRAFGGSPMDSSYAATHTPDREGDATFISASPAEAQDQFAVSYDGTLTVPSAGLYRFALTLGWRGGDADTRVARVGGGKLTIDGVPLAANSETDRRSYADRELSAGPHRFSLTFYKNRPSFNRRDMALWVEGPGVERQALHDEAGASTSNTPVNPIVMDQEAEPVMLRSFLRHRNTKRVIAISVADPRGVHYSYDLSQGALLYAWRGPFLETTQMWHERGEDQTAEPLGSVLTLAGTPALAFLSDAKAAWPDSIADVHDLHRGGYQLDASRRPVFLYRVRDVSVEDAIRPESDGLSLRRELHLRGAGSGLYLQLAQGDHITREADGSYAVGDRSFYVTLPAGGTRPTIRRMNDRDELVMPVHFDRGEAKIVYNIVW